MGTQNQRDRDALREWAVFYEAGLRRQNSDVNLTQAQIAKDRARLEADPIEWIKFFFPDYCKFEFADFQIKAIRAASSTKNGLRCFPGRGGWQRVPR